MDKDKELEEAVELITELYEWCHMDDMIKDYKEKDERDDEEFLSYCIFFRGQVLDFLKKHAKKKDPDEVVIEAVSDLWARDVEELLNSGKEKQARALMKVMGLSKEEVEKTINERKGETA